MWHTIVVPVWVSGTRAITVSGTKTGTLYCVPVNMKCQGQKLTLLRAFQIASSIVYVAMEIAAELGKTTDVRTYRRLALCSIPTTSLIVPILSAGMFSHTYKNNKMVSTTIQG